MAPLGAKSASPYLDLRGAELRRRAKMVFSVAISEIRWAESVPSETVLALVIQNGPTWAKSALKKLGPIWLLGPIRLFPFYSVRRHKQTFGKVTTTGVLDKDENLL